MHTYNLHSLLVHSPGGATQSLLFVDCHFIRHGAPLNYCYFMYFSTNLCFFKNVPTQSPTFVLGVPIVRQLLPTPKSVCYISNYTYSASFSRFCPIWRWQPCCKLLPQEALQACFSMTVANRTWHVCDVTPNQRPSSHVSSHITGSPVRSSQITKPIHNVYRRRHGKKITYPGHSIQFYARSYLQ